MTEMVLLTWLVEAARTEAKYANGTCSLQQVLEELHDKDEHGSKC